MRAASWSSFALRYLGQQAWLEGFTVSEFDPAKLLTAAVIDRGGPRPRSRGCDCKAENVAVHTRRASYGLGQVEARQAAGVRGRWVSTGTEWCGCAPGRILRREGSSIRRKGQSHWPMLSIEKREFGFFRRCAYCGVRHSPQHVYTGPRGDLRHFLAYRHAGLRIAHLRNS
jgi:hypothetical protein